jgi:chaperonin GroES
LNQVAESEEETAGGLLLTQATKEKPSVGTVSNFVMQSLPQLI